MLETGPLVRLYTDSSLQNYTYMLKGADGWLCVDPYNAEQVIDFVLGAGGSLAAIINTHEHWDHVKGNDTLVSKTGCQVWAHVSAAGKIKGLDRLLAAGESIELDGSWSMEVMDTPGHTFAHLCLLIKEVGRPWGVISGDTLFNAGVGNCHNGGAPETLYETISRQFHTLPDVVRVFPGHEYLANNLRFTLSREPSNSKAKSLLRQVESLNPKSDEFPVTTIGQEREHNTFFRLEEAELINNLGIDDKSAKSVFLKLRELRNKW